MNKLVPAVQDRLMIVFGVISTVLLAIPLLIYQMYLKASGQTPLFAEFGDHVLLKFEKNEESDIQWFSLSSSKYKNFNGKLVFYKEGIKSHFTNGKWMMPKDIIENIIVENEENKILLKCKFKDKNPEKTLGTLVDLDNINIIKNTIEKIGFNIETRDLTIACS